MNEGTGTYANDSSGYDNNGTITNAIWSTDNVSSTALSFDGSGDYVTVPASDSLNATTALTMATWFKADTSQNNGLITKTIGGVFNTQYQLFQSNVIAFRLAKNAALTQVTSNSAPQNNTWVYVQAVWDGSTVYMYVNGVQQTSTASLASPIDGGSGVTYLGALDTTTYILNGKMDEIKIYNYALNSSERTQDYQEFQPVPAYPTGGLTVSATYPPQTTTINFSWHDTEYPGDRLQVAKDSSFNQLVVDITTVNDYYSANLESGLTYYWKVTQYNGTTGLSGDTSQTENFTIAGVSGASGQGIQGVVYEKISGITTPVNGATVYITNASWSSTQIVGTNGYYLFSGLANDTYQLVASKKDYTSSATQYVTVNGSMVTQDILIEACTSIYTCGSGTQYVKFIVQDWFGITKYAYIAANVFKGSEAAASLTGTTGTDGAVTFLLIKDQQYTITFTNSSQGVSESVTIIPADTQYYIIVDDTALPWWENQTYNAVDTVKFSVTTSTPNATHAYINITYNDSLAQTSGLTFYVNQSNHTGLNATQTVIQSYSSASTGNTTYSFLISSYGGKSYLVNVRATHTTFGSIYRSFGVHFQGTESTTDDFIPDKLKAILAIGFMIFIGGIFGEVRAAMGAAIFCGLGWIFFFWDWFNWFGVNEAAIGIGLVIGSIVTIMWNMKGREDSEGMV